MKKILILLFIPILLFSQSDAEKATKTRLGDTVPSFTLTNSAGKLVNVSDLKGKVVLINFFATWCPPCLAELPHLEKDIWNKYKNDDFVLLVVGREHTEDELNEFGKKKSLNLPFVPDPKREIFSKFAEHTIPRNFLIDKEGKIVAQYIGFNNEDFSELKTKIEKLLK